MKKILNISVIAALAILPMAANAEVGQVVSSTEPAHADSATAATANPGYALATEGANDGNLATAGYVKGAYNATMKAINKVATTATNAADKDLSNLSETGTGVITTAITNNAAGATYSNTSSGLTASTLQGAIDELASEKADKSTTLSGYGITDGANTALSNITSDGENVIKGLAAQGGYDNTQNYAADTIGATIKSLENTAGNAADKDLSNLSTAGTGVITTNVTTNAASGTFSSTKGLSSVTLGTAIDELADEKADKSTTLSGYGITDAYTQTEVDTAIAGSANTATYSSATTYDTGTVGAAIKSLQTSGATQAGVENTIETATITATVPTLTTWNVDTSVGTAPVTVASISASYAEPANP